MAVGDKADMTAQSNQVISALKNLLTTAGFALVTTRRLTNSELADSEFPAVIIEPGQESQSPLSNGFADVNWLVVLRLHVLSASPLSAADNWREKAALIGKAIAGNRSLNGSAIDTKISGRMQDLSVFEPFSSGTLDLTIRFRFNELTQGG